MECQKVRPLRTRSAMPAEGEAGFSDRLPGG
jgi:hypothetical protein